MTRRKAKSPAAIKRKWPYHVALVADKVRGLKNSETVRSFADTLSVARSGSGRVFGVVLCHPRVLRKATL
jgi:hypothetical protein